ncbi:hypothetical protein [Thermotalea metallivorans]|uniref:Uncharacterized protein n=1 Tax=Thermotalea metallivorans TaxID=520762 RepID=A0A140L4Y5_9FIRM|nr:hypothetical protein [Thermotalea metallivorans]KXG75610.1 hypothetical protein AN619_16060 [Thermotalea metallivorans]
MNFFRYGLPMVSGLFVLVNLGIIIYMVYLFHILATSNKQIAESMQILVNKIDKLGNKDSL